MHGRLGLRAHQDLLGPLAHQEHSESKGLRVSPETTGNRVCLHPSPLDQTSFLRTLLTQARMKTVMGAAPRGCQVCQASLGPRVKKEIRESLV